MINFLLKFRKLESMEFKVVKHKLFELFIDRFVYEGCIVGNSEKVIQNLIKTDIVL